MNWLGIIIILVAKLFHHELINVEMMFSITVKIPLPLPPPCYPIPISYLQGITIIDRPSITLSLAPQPKLEK